MDNARIAEWLQPFLTRPLSSLQLAHISMYIDILLKWNQRINLTAVRQEEEMVTRHFGESLFAAQSLFPGQGETSVSRSPGETNGKEATKLVDVGAGAGFPGLPIKVWAPDIRLTLIESNHKKATFLKEAVRALGLTDVEVFAGRAETFPVASADVVTLRAVERFESILPIAAALVRTGGILALLIGAAQIEPAKQVCKKIEWRAPLVIPMSTSRILLHGQKATNI